VFYRFAIACTYILLLT